MQRGKMSWIALICGLLACQITAAQTLSSETDYITVREGESFQLSCSTSVGSGAVRWEKDGELFSNDAVVSVASANSSHTGMYVCMVSGDVEESRSRPIIVTVISLHSGEDSAPLIALIVCVSTITLIIGTLVVAIGVYMCCCRMESSRCKSCCSCCQRHNKKPRSREGEWRKPPSFRSRHFSRGIRTKSLSLSELLHATPEEFPLDNTSTNILSGSQPTQTTVVEDPNTLEFDLALDEAMFEHTSPPASPHRLHPPSKSSKRTDKIQLFSRERPSSDRRAENQVQVREQRRASEGLLVVNDAVRKSILKESKSFAEDMQSQRMSSTISNMSSDITQSDENSLHLGKSVRFNVSGDDSAEDSGVHTGSTTPHNRRRSKLVRHASEPEALGHHFKSTERRGSAPGDLASEGRWMVAGRGNEGDDECESETEDNSGEVDEGLATGSEECGEREKIRYEESRARRRFEGAFLQMIEENKIERKTGQEVKLEPGSSGIATRVAQLYSGQKQVEGTNAASISKLAVSSNPEVVPKMKVSQMKERFLQGEEKEEQKMTGREEGRRLSLSKLVQERAEVFREKDSNDEVTVSRTGSLRRKQQQEETAMDHGEKHVTENRNESPEKEKRSIDVLPLPSPTTEPTRTSRKSKPPAPIKEPKQASMIPIPIPVFSAPSGLSNWVPACLRETVIAPVSYGADDEQGQDSDDSDDDGVLMEPLKPTTGRSFLGAGPLSTLASFGATAAISPMGRSWLQSGKTPGPAIPSLVTKPKMPGGSEKSSFNEPFSHLAAIKRLSVIPEETASACNSVLDVSKEPTH